ncbi:MAG TPA: alpha/beta hydrolase [Rhodocyclaceae bacterium]|nr:alpha/beta hydrolase [Rhodocyclaceae bacterium]
MPHANINGRNIYHELHGEGEAIVTVLNGLTMSTVAWAALVKDFAPHTRILLLDLCGQGQSDRPDEPIYPLARQASDVAGLLDHLGIAKTNLIGLSYGGVVAQHFALNHPEKLNKLILTDTLAYNDEVNQKLGDVLEEAQEVGGSGLRFRVMLPITFGNNFIKAAAALLPTMEAASIAFPWSAVKSLIAGTMTHDLREQHKNIKAETLMIVGEDDRFTPIHHARMIANAIPGCKLRILPGLAHAAPIEGPHIWNPIALSFLQGTYAD